MEHLSVGCIVMAAGNASRFGSNKLAARVNGKPLIQLALEAVPRERFSAVAVVSQYPFILELAGRLGFLPVENARPDRGVSHTIRLGLEALPPCDGVLFQVADQPRLRRETVGALVDLWRSHPERIAALGHGGIRGNPCLFPARFFPELLALEGDQGGGAVIRRHPEALLLLETAAEELRDVDTQAALAELDGQDVSADHKTRGNDTL